MSRPLEPQLDVELVEHAQPAQETSPATITPAKPILWKLYLSHTLSTWNARTFEFGAVIFLATIFPDTLFYTSLYALCRSGAAAIFSSWVGGIVDRTHRLTMVRHSIIWARCSVAISCLLLLLLLQDSNSLWILPCFAATVTLACVEKLAFIGNTVSVERDWIIVVADSLSLDRQELNSSMRRIDLVCKLVAPLAISLVDAYSNRLAIWAVFGQNLFSALFEYFAIARVFVAIPELCHRKREITAVLDTNQGHVTNMDRASDPTVVASGYLAYVCDFFRPYKDYFHNPAFLASFSLSLLYLTVLSFGSQMTTYLLTLNFTALHISAMRLVAVILELSATCAAPMLMKKIGPVRSGLWFVNEQLIAVVLAVSLFSAVNTQTRLAAAALIFGVTLSRLGLWGFDLCVQFLVQEDAPTECRGSFSTVEVALQSVFELISFAMTMIFSRPEDFKYPIYISATAIAISAACFAGFVRRKRGHLLHASKCFKREDKRKYHVLPTIEEES
ncbi:iron transporter [Pleomassaria siparia CBS 279.74]|uniref:Solute carrier family 40 member n=1 Tax=Pleomassaria siparia CBS 279.74 TaxID=1314801 RepID=A0A6G1KMY0_9PLEO|nr:iron transporter [Pleomassaria siparia CBS 279.74]